MDEEYDSREEFMDDLRERYQEGRFEDAARLVQQTEYQVDDDTREAVMRRYQAARKIGDAVGAVPDHAVTVTPARSAARSSARSV